MKRIFVIILLLICLSNPERTLGSPNAYIFTGAVNYDNPSSNQSVFLEANNYSIVANHLGYLYWYYSSTAEFTLKKDSTLLFTYQVLASDEFNYNITGRITIQESGSYDLSFIMDTTNPTDFVNYQVILSEIELVINQKTDIISQAPFGMSIIRSQVLQLRVARSDVCINQTNTLNVIYKTC